MSKTVENILKALDVALETGQSDRNKFTGPFGDLIVKSMRDVDRADESILGASDAIRRGNNRVLECIEYGVTIAETNPVSNERLVLWVHKRQEAVEHLIALLEAWKATGSS